MRDFTNMTELLFGIALFFGMHSISVVAEPIRDRIAAKNELSWKMIYSLTSLVGLILMSRGYADARMTPTILYLTPSWMRHVAAVLLLPTFVFFLASIFPGKIKETVKHPILIAVKSWAVAHLLVNGMLADVLLFGSFLVWAVLVRISMRSRTPRVIPGAPPSSSNDVISIVAGIALYLATVFWLHEWVIGVRPFV